VRSSCLLPLLALLACVGPPASDGELCHDTLQRLCQARACPGASESLALPAEDCAGQLAARTGCAGEGFSFTTPTRERFLVCRTPLVRTSTQVGATPACEEVAEVVEECPDVVAFLKGEAP
jgi:hypothetical protein